MAARPQVKATVQRVYSTNPRKPNSANRKVAKVTMGSRGRSALAALKGVPHNLRRYSKVWLCGRGFKDTPGVNTRVMVGKDAFSAPQGLLKRRSVYGVKRQVI